MNSLYLKILRLWVMKNFHRCLKTFVVFVITCLIIVGCESTESVLNENFMFFSKFPKEDTVVFKNIFEYKEGIAGMLRFVDSTLIILNVQPGANTFLYYYSLNKSGLSNGHVGKGRGPGEAMAPIAIGVNGNRLWLQDITLRRVFVIDKRNLINKTTHVSFNEYPLKNDYYMIDFKDSTHFFSVGFRDSKYKIQEIDLISGKVINEYGKIDKTPGNVSLRLFKSIYQSFIFTKPTGDKLVLPYRFLDAIEIYNINTGSSVAIHGPEGFNVEYKPMGDLMIKTEKTKFAFVNGTVTNEYIYLAYSGISRYNPDYYYGNCIYIYDWDGNPIRKLILDRYIQGMAVSKDNKTLYAFDVNSGFLIQAKIN